MNCKFDEKILIIGSGGQVSTALIKSLEESPNVYQAGKEESDFNNFISLDLLDENQLKEILLSVKPNIVINAAAYTAVDKAEKERELAFKINCTAPGIIANLCSEIGSTLVHYSTDYVFDGSGDQPRSENADTRPINYYGETKLQGEKIIQNECKDHYIFRTSWVFSEFGQNFVKTMIKLGKEKESLNIIDDQIGSPTSAKEITRGTLEVVRQLSDRSRKHNPGIYNLTCQGETSWFNFANNIFEIYRKLGNTLNVKSINPIPTTSYPTPAARPLNSRLDCTKIKKEFQFEANNWKDELKLVLYNLSQ